LSTPDRSIPADLRRRIRRLESNGYIQLRLGSFVEAEATYNRIYQILFERQSTEDRPIHKGAPLHMRGNALLPQRNRLEDSLRSFLLAYIEDTFNVPLGSEAEADGSPAGRTLRQAFQLEENSLGILKGIALSKKNEGLWGEVRDPEQILEEFLSQRRPRRGQILSLCGQRPRVRVRRSVNQIPGEWERRVFIGGNYDNMWAIREIERVVQELGYQPIIALDFDIPEDLIRHHDLMLLHNCKWAIFEVTLGNGHLMEIERTNDYENEVLLLYNVRDERRECPPSMSMMIRTFTRAEMLSYLDPEELRRIISDFLPQDENT